ncbi:adenosylcobinamide-GDP ribazoletransferase [Anaerofilum sp. An201]|nr:adenosylcobinamide-GDP ribazoletransferase [Anaerofilum sp. An201]OUP03975.1 adenosylcobinamide-GDP ribazoletransferase [Anaerofilum sp. An201]
MILFETIAVAFAMFSAIPCPQPVWNQKNMRYSLCAFPLIGAVCGLFWWGWTSLLHWAGGSSLLLAGGLCAIPVLVTGGIHLDGYADTSDALASCAPPEKKREILQDPRCGAFAVIRLCTWFALYFALCGSVRWDGRALWCMSLAFVLERCLSGFAIAAFPLAKNTGLAHTFAAAADKTKVRRVLAAASMLLASALAVTGGLAGAAMVLAAGWILWRYCRVSQKQFGGITGDLAGWFLQRAELWMLSALAAAQLLEGMKWFS